MAYFQALFDRICGDLQRSTQEMSSDFLQLSTNQQRVSYALSIPSVHSYIKVKPMFKGKSAMEATKLREFGNKMFGQKDYDSALQMYSESVLKAPFDPNVNHPVAHGNMNGSSHGRAQCDKNDVTTNDGNEFSLALANRSAVLFSLGKYDLSMKDIDLALHHGYPKELTYKLHERKGRCLWNLGRDEEALQSFLTAKEHVTKSSLNSKKRKSWKATVDKQIAALQRTPSSVESADPSSTTNIPSVSYGTNSTFPSLSTAVEIRQSEQRGRHAVAAQDIRVGDVLIVEKPYGSVVLPEQGDTHCDYCCRRVSAPLPCQQCSTARYCSHECADLAWTQYHGVECQYLGLIHSSGVGGMGHLALRLVNRTGFHFLQEFERTLEDNISRKVNEPEKNAQDRNSGNTDYKDFPGLNDEGVYTNDYNSVYNLENHSLERKPSDLFRRTVMAIFLLRILQNGGVFLVPAQEVAEEDQLLVASHLLRHLQMIPCNAHEVSEFEFYRGDPDRCRYLEVASALHCTMLGMFNHSCDPVINRNFYGDVLVARAIRPVAKGEEITLNYSVLYTTQSRMERQYKLAGQYFFKCSCQPCAENWPLFYDMVQDLQTRNKLPKLKCRHCFSMLPGSEDKVINKMKCSVCGEEQELQALRTQLDSIVDEVFTKVGQVVTGEVESSLPALERCLERMEKIVARPYGYYDSCQEAIKQCYGIVGNCYERTTS
ncbi:SET and MYND domain-containing protein 4-like [Branchiostoma floridae]|uniref:Protein-lysine N-methyltransferase SMYD4 n=1 Tax=Branchiostoma floridae TaxID=7739 RepID=A0A9J7L050_BRAFL|nr:SET and MYND domain-containing protein 4-like [Branchiostoma floridae]